MSNPLSRLSKDRKMRQEDEQEFSVHAVARKTGTKEMVAGVDSLEGAMEKAEEIADDYALSNYNIFIHNGKKGIHLRLEKEQDEKGEEEVFTFEDLTKK